jgi:pimeloyl-ACP methyl ester carboxylesterase
MYRRPRLCAVAVATGLATSALSVSTPATAAESQHRTGRTANGTWVLDVPAKFNGTLLLWSHGYTFEPVPASNAPTTAVRDALLDRGYALVGSSYAKGGAGWAVREGVRAGIEAIGIAERKIGARRVDTVYAWGNSLGGLITQTLAERRPDLVDGVAPVCGVLAGTNRNLDLALDMAVGVKHFFYPKLRLRGYKSRVVAEENYAAAAAEILRQLADPATQASATGRMLALAALMDASARTKSYDGNGTSSSVRGATESVLTALNYGTLGRYDIEQRVGGNPSTNAGTDYTARVTRDSTARFKAFGFGTGLLKSFAQSLQTYGKRVKADPAARRAANRLGNPTGDLSDRTVTMHTVFDPLVLVQNERVFANRVGKHDDGKRLLQLYVRPPSTYATSAPYGAGHCNFATDQYVAAISALDTWVTSGDRPSSAELTQLFSTHPGALDLDYTPARWPAR